MIMKKILLIAVATITLVACNKPTLKEQYTALTQETDAALDTMTDMTAFEALLDSYIAQVMDMYLGNMQDEYADSVLFDVYYLLDTNQKTKIFDAMSKEKLASEGIKDLYDNYRIEQITAVGNRYTDIAALLALPGIRGEGLFTHLANADGDEDYTMAQFTRFLEARDALKARGMEFEICHCASSAAVLKYPCTHLDMIRPGLALYGFSPMGEDDEPELKPVLTLKSRVAAVRALPKGTPVSYGCTQVLRRDSRLAVVPIGYGDGYPRALSGRMEMRIRGQLCPIVGRVCMDMCMVDVTDVPDAAAGDVATVYDGHLLERAAALAGTIPYELMCDVNPRVPRVYLRNGQRV